MWRPVCPSVPIAVPANLSLGPIMSGEGEDKPKMIKYSVIPVKRPLVSGSINRIWRKTHWHE